MVNYIVQLNEIAISNAHRQTIIIPHRVGEDRINLDICKYEMVFLLIDLYIHLSTYFLVPDKPSLFI